MTPEKQRIRRRNICEFYNSLGPENEFSDYIIARNPRSAQLGILKWYEVAVIQYMKERYPEEHVIKQQLLDEVLRIRSLINVGKESAIIAKQLRELRHKISRYVSLNRLQYEIKQRCREESQA